MRKTPGTQPRQKIIWTLKAKLIFGLAVLLHVFSAFLFYLLHLYFWTKILWFIFFLIAFLNIYPLFFVLAALLIWPLDFLAKTWIVARAKRKLRNLPDLKIIGITGSYGKTTIKEALESVLARKYRVLKTPENINTPVGIARLILRELNPEVEILIVEMGAYRVGDIKTLCQIAPPDVAVLTGINEAHLERFGSIEKTIRGKFEIVDHAKPNALAVLNSDNQLVMKNYQARIRSRKVEFYSAYKAKNVEFDSNPVLPLYKGEVEGVHIQTQILGEYVFGIAHACIIIGKHLGLTIEQIQDGIAAFKPIPHRLQPIYNAATDVLVIDDSYNGNPAGAREAIEVLGKFRNRRKIYITPGLVEMGERTAQVHREIGQQLGKVADKVILIKNSATPFIAEGLAQTNFHSQNIIWFPSSQSAHAAISSIVQKGDVILFQNDWPENYI